MTMIILLSIFGPLLAGCVILAIVMYSSFMANPDSRKDIKKLEPKTFLKIIARSKVFPVVSNNGWRLFTYSHNTRVWTQSFLGDGEDDRILVYTTYCKMPASSQVVYQTIRDIGKLKDWKPGVVTCSLVKSNKGGKSGPPNQSPYKMDKGMGQDVIQEIVINTKSQDYTEEVVPQQYIRHWNREDNGCCWMLQTSQDKCQAVFFLVQPVEDMDSCLVTVLVHNVLLPSAGATQVACLLGSLRDYLSLRKVKSTPLTSIRMPNFINNSQTSMFADSSSDEERDKQFYDRFSSLNDKQKSLVLQKSESILRLRSNSQGKLSGLQQRRSQSDTDIIGIVMGDTDSRSHPIIQPADNAQHSSNLLHSNIEPGGSLSQKGFHSEHSPIESGDQNIRNSEDMVEQNKKIRCENGGINGHGETEQLLRREEQDTDTGSVVSSIESETPLDDVFDLSDAQPTTPADVVKFMTLANQSAADILALAVRVSNIELRKTQSQQTESSGGWAFWGLEMDVVIFKKIFNRSNSLFSFVGKGLINASPQRVFEAIKNPRTRFTYDESLKKVDVLSSIADKAKIVYFYHELVYMFKKECFDFCVLQNERMDGEKFVIAMQSVDYGLPVPSGTERVQMLPSGWIIEPVTRDNKQYSMATYVMQIDFNGSRMMVEKQPIEEMVSKQPLSIEYLRQYLRPAIMLARQASAGGSLRK
ncbi:stAR-related lipid transfer protein 9-like isoform X2 [Argopecten irradians]|uniref:stAR-related lipid transfer protein 9-like isoform X2 n=1 Tax=Argopecten irradians TaxID=31199 RepID=UPI0037225A28